MSLRVKLQGKAEANKKEIPHNVRNRLRNLALSNEIATHLLGARNDRQSNCLLLLSLDLKRIFFCFIIFVLLVSNVSGFSIPEKFQYDLTLGGIKIGTVSLETKESGPYVQLISRVTSVKWVSLFYKVDDTAVSFISKQQPKKPEKTFLFHPATYRINLNEGANKIYKEFSFDHTKKRVSYIDYLNKEKLYYMLKDLTFDPLSSLYYIRGTPLQVGKSIFVNIFNNKLIYKVEVQVLRKETVKTPLGTFNTVLIRSNMTSAGDGIFYLPGDIYIWLTDDEKRIPVLFEKKINALVEGKLPDFLKKKMPNFLKKKISTGSIVATLIKR
jgi:hypothetical protein